MFLLSLSFVVTLILHSSSVSFGDVVITIKSEEGAPRKYQFTVESSSSKGQVEPRPRASPVSDAVSLHQPLTFYVPPPSTSTTPKPQLYRSQSRPPIFNVRQPVKKKKRPKYHRKVKKIHHKPWRNLIKTRPRFQRRDKRKTKTRRLNLFENIVNRYRG